MLVKLGKLIAPITPFVTEVMYQNLVRKHQPNGFESVHMTYYPEADKSAVNQTLIEEMELPRSIASLGSLGTRQRRMPKGASTAGTFTLAFGLDLNQTRWC